MRRLIDANIILRYLLGDHPQMSAEAKKIIEKGAFTLSEVIAEVVYVLKGVYAETSLDFVDCILIARNRLLHDNVITFDKKLNKMLK